MEFCPNPKFHGIPWNFSFSPTISSEFHGIFWSSMKFHGIPWNLINLIFKKIIFLNIVSGIWLMIRCYLAKISQKRYILHWFQYRSSHFKHPSVGENGARSAQLACCNIYDIIYIYICAETERKLMKNVILLSNIRTTPRSKLDFQTVDQHPGCIWLTHGTKYHKGNQWQSLEVPCRISPLSSSMDRICHCYGTNSHLQSSSPKLIVKSM